MIKGKNIDKNVFTFSNRTVFDLSGEAAVEFAFIHHKAITINSISVAWVEASSTDTGIALEVGSTSGGAEYASITSGTSKAAASVDTYTGGDLTLTLVPAGTPIFIGHVGSKVGAGTCYVIVAYTVV